MTMPISYSHTLEAKLVYDLSCLANHVYKCAKVFIGDLEMAADY